MIRTKKKHYPWWNRVRAAVRAYPARMGKYLTGEEKREQDAVQAAIDTTVMMCGGGDRLAVIRMVHWERTHSLEGAALMIPCSRATAARWQRSFFKEVARRLDAPG